VLSICSGVEVRPTQTSSNIYMRHEFIYRSLLPQSHSLLH